VVAERGFLMREVGGAGGGDEGDGELEAFAGVLGANLHGCVIGGNTEFEHLVIGIHDTTLDRHFPR